MNASSALPDVSPLQDPRLADCRRIFVRGFELMASIGFYDTEREHRQRIRIGIDVFVPLAVSTPVNDDPGEIIDYDFIRREVSAIVHSQHFNLQETLLDRIVDACLAHPGVRAVRACTEKPDIYPGDMTAGIEVFRFNPR
ncbi:MAG: dihydroneopterin aldolase [Burkholderiaceae bacterium]